MSTNNVHYWVTDTKDKEQAYEGHACFSSLNGANLASVKSIRYRAMLEGDVTREEASWWMEWLPSLLVTLPFEARFDKHDGKDCIIWTLTKVSPNYYHTLLYLTAFRIPDEYPKILKYVFKEKEGDSAPGKVLKALWDGHGKLLNGHWNDDIHTLMRPSSRYGSGNVCPTFEKALANIRVGDNRYVHACFAA